MTRFLLAAGALAFVLGAAGNATAQGIPIVTVVDASGDENGTDGAVEFILSTGGVPVTGNVFISATYSFDGSATAADLSRRPNGVTIPIGQSGATLRVPIFDDTLREGNETFTVTISVNSGLARIAGGTRTVTGTILANDGGSPPAASNDATVSIDDASGAEDRGAVNFRVRLSRAVDSDVLLAVTVTPGSGSDAAAAADLGGPLPTTVSIPANTTSATLTVPIINDDVEEEDETFDVAISARSSSPLPTGVTIRDGTATGTIIDDDDGTAPPPVATPITVSIADDEVAENVSGGHAEFMVTLSEAVDSAVELGVTYASGSGNGATLATDLGTRPSSVTIAANATSATLRVPIVNDSDIEEDETFTVTITLDAGAPSNVTVSRGTATGTITNDDAAPPPVATPITVSIANASASEADGVIGFAVRLTAAAPEDFTLFVSVDGVTASTSIDDVATLGPLDLGMWRGAVDINQGDTSGTFSVPIVADDLDEGAETFTVTLSPSFGGLPDGVTIGRATATGTITADDGTAPPTPPAPPASDVTVSIANASAREADGTIDFAVRLTAAAPEDFTLLVSVDGVTASTSIDDVATLGPLDLGMWRGTVDINQGDTRGTFSVPIVADDLDEGAETFTVTLSPGFGGLPDDVTIGTATATGTITESTDSVAGPREIGAGTALRRHAGRFDSLTGAVVRNRLDARATRRLSASENVGNGAAAAGGGLGETRWGAWIDGAWAGFDGEASGRQADVYGGVDYQAGDWLIGALIGYETADLDIDKTAYRSDYTQFGVYGGARVSERLLFDGAATYGTATPDVTLEGVTSSYDASRLTVRGALTGDLGIGYGHGLKVQPRLGLLYSREQLDESAGGAFGRETLKLGRFSAGPRLTWEFDGGQVAGGVHAQWDFLELDDGVGNRISGAADIGVNLDLTPNVILGVQGDIDGIGTSGDFGSLGGRVKLDVRF